MEGSKKSETAHPSRVNSGLAHTAKSVPARFRLAASMGGMTKDFAVPGNTVLRSTTQWNSFLNRSALPTSSQLPSPLLKSNHPFSTPLLPTPHNHTPHY